MFKRGSEYTRDEIAKFVRPENPPRGGDWDTGYARIENDLFVFMNIGVAGRTGHDAFQCWRTRARARWFILTVPQAELI